MIPGEGEERKKPVPCSGLKKRPVNGQRRRRSRGGEDRCFSASSTNLAISGGFKEIERHRRSSRVVYKGNGNVS